MQAVALHKCNKMRKIASRIYVVYPAYPADRLWGYGMRMRWAEAASKFKKKGGVKMSKNENSRAKIQILSPVTGTAVPLGQGPGPGVF